jgi:predicted permease
VGNAPAKAESAFTWVSPDYFATLATPIVAGRDFTANDSENAPRVAVVNEIFARQYFPGVNPIGQVFRTVAEPHYPEAEYRIVGLIRNTRYLTLKGEERPMAYGALPQYPPGPAGALMYVRSSAPLSAVETSLRRSVAAWRPGTPVQFQILQQQIADSLTRERLLAALSGVFGALAAVLATIGLYGVLAYQTMRRRNELGIRVALGATRRQIVGLVVREATLLVAVGLAIGLACSVAAGNVAASLLFGISARDPWRLAGAALALAIAAAIGSLLPARRAARLDPMTALRDE